MKSNLLVRSFSCLVTVRMLLTLALWIATSVWPASGQMVTGAGMEDFDKTFGISAKGWTVQQIGCSLGANVLWPGEKATFTFFVKPGRTYKGPLKVDVIQYGTKGKPGDWWKPMVFKIADISSSTVEVDLPADGGMVTVSPRIGDAFGGYARHPGSGRARTRLWMRLRARACPGTGPRAACPPTRWTWVGRMRCRRQVFNVFKRLGVKGARTEGGYNTIGTRILTGPWRMTSRLMLTVGCGNTPDEQQPLGTGPALAAETGEHLHRRDQGGSRLAAVVRSGVQALPQRRDYRNTAGPRARSMPSSCGMSPGKACPSAAGARISRVSANSTR